MSNGCGPENLPIGDDIPGDPFVPDNPNLFPIPGLGPSIPCLTGDESFFPPCMKHDICYSTCNNVILNL